jgi:hypothetical protein
MDKLLQSFSVFIFILSVQCSLSAQSFFNSQSGGLSNKNNVINSHGGVTKTSGNVLWSEDFDGSLSNCWSVVNLSSGVQWRWDTIYQSGTYTTPPFASSTAANGFMLLPLDQFSSVQTTGGLPAHTYFESCAISIQKTSNVILKLEQYNALCCGAGKAVVQVSVDGFSTFDEYDLLTEQGHKNMSVSKNPSITEIDVSRTLANSSVAYLRFYIEGYNQYFWMIDDISLEEGRGQRIKGMKVWNIKADSNRLLPIVPRFLTSRLAFSGTIENPSADTISNLKLKITVNHKSKPNGGAGAGVIYVDSNYIAFLPPYSFWEVILDSNLYGPIDYGEYDIIYEVVSGEYPLVVSDTLHRIISDTVLGKDYGDPIAWICSKHFVSDSGISGGSMDGDKIALFYHLDSTFSKVPSSLSYYVSSSPYNEGAIIRPFIATLDSSGVGVEVASTLNPRLIDTTDFDSWVSISLDTGLAMGGLSSGDYILGFEVVGGTVNGASFEIGNEMNGDVYEEEVTFVFLGHAPGEGWRIASMQPMIRLNFTSPISVGLPDKKTQGATLNLFPNPSNGVVNLEINLLEANANYQLQLINSMGQLVWNKQFNVHGVIKERIDWSSVRKGVYFLNLRGRDGFSSVRRVIIQ